MAVEFKEPLGCYLVSQSNQLIEARHKNPLTKNEQKLVLMLISMIEQDDEDFKEYSISVDKFAELIGAAENRKGFYSYLKSLLEKIMSKVIELPRPDGSYKLIHWIGMAEYVSGEGVVRLKLFPDLKPYLLQLRDHYTSYQLNSILSLSSGYSIRLYELIKRYQNIGTWTVNVDDLRQMLGATKKTFERYNALKTKILEKAVTELNSKTDTHISYKELKEGRKVAAIEFTIIRRIVENMADTSLLLKEIQDIIPQKLPIDITIDITNKALALWSDEPKIIEELTYLSNYAFSNINIVNPVGFIRIELEKSIPFAKSGHAVSFSHYAVTKPIIPDFSELSDEMKQMVETIYRKRSNQEELTLEELSLLDKLDKQVV